MKNRLLGVIFALASLGALASGARADVTIQQNSVLDVASVIRMHGASTTTVSPDKKREDVESHCEGVMSLVCGNMHSGDIVRLDRDVTWQLEPDKKRYREQAFSTPEELAAMRAKLQANLEKMRSCPASQKQQQQQPIDKSQCEMSPPKVDVHKTDDRMSIAGHDAQRTTATLTETCTNKTTGEVCDTIIAVDLWLTQETLPGSADRRAFDSVYAKKLGLDDTKDIMRGQVARFLAPYQAQIKQLTDKSSDLKGQPLRTSLRVLMGGPQCKSVAKSGGSEDAGTASPTNPLGDAAERGKALGASVGHLVGGLFHKKKADDADGTTTDTANATPPAAAPSTLPTVAAKPDPYAQYSQLATFTLETVSINTDPVPAARFDIPADWTKVIPKASKGDDDFTCPKT